MPTIRQALLLLLGLLACAGAARAQSPDQPLDQSLAQPLHPTLHDDFDHYTFALTWQPGFCAAGEGCAADQPRQPLIGIHGLWASLPRSLAERGVVNTQWWATGCDWLSHSDAQPVLPAPLLTRIRAAMPHVHGDLLRHEYDKHVQCFGFDPATFFATELAMRDAVLRTPFAAALQSRVGQTVQHAALAAEFARSFHTAAPRAVQFQCHADHQGRVVLTQFWITIRHDRLDRFPEPASLTDSPVVQDNCPDQFTIPAW